MDGLNGAWIFSWWIGLCCAGIFAAHVQEGSPAICFFLHQFRISLLLWRFGSDWFMMAALGILVFLRLMLCLIFVEISLLLPGSSWFVHKELAFCSIRFLMIEDFASVSLEFSEVLMVWSSAASLALLKSFVWGLNFFLKIFDGTKLDEFLGFAAFV